MQITVQIITVTLQYILNMYISQQYVYMLQKVTQSHMLHKAMCHMSHKAVTVVVSVEASAFIAYHLSQSHVSHKATCLCNNISDSDRPA